MKKRDEDGETYDFPKQRSNKAKSRQDYVNNLYPIIYKGAKYDKEDCDDIFISFYHCKEALNDMCGVYLSEGMWIYPDGNIEHW